MPTYYVSGTGNDTTGDGSSGNPWRTFTKAHAEISAGDTVICRNGTYTGRVTISKANTTWQAAAGHSPTFNGGWHEGLKSSGLMPVPTGSHYPPGRDDSFILVSANGVTLDGLTILNSAGRGIGVGDADGVTVRKCTVNFTYETCFHVNPGTGNTASDLLVENCTFIRGGNKRVTVGFSPTDNWPGNVNCKSVIDMVFQKNIVAYSQGEGVNIHQYCERAIVQDCVIHDFKALGLYITRVKDTIFRRNFIFNTGVPLYLDANGKAYAGIVVGDESSSSLPTSTGSQIYNNIIVNCSRGFEFRNGASYVGSQMKELYFGFNTIVAGPHSKGCVNVGVARPGLPHVSSIFENNVFYRAGRSVPIAEGNATGILFRNNNWDALPSSTFQGAGDQIGNPNLSDPTALLQNVYPNPVVPYDLTDYRSTVSSTRLIGLAGNSSTANGLTPPTITTDFVGTSRGTPKDIGAFEYTAGGTDPPPPPPPPEPPPGVGTALVLGPSSIAQQNSGGTVEVDSAATAQVELTGANFWGGLRFTAVTIPQGSQVNTAYLEFTPSSTTSDSPTIEIDLQAHDNAPVFAATSNYLSGLTLTGNAAAYTATDTGLYRLYSPSLVAAVQAVVSRAGWATGNAVNVILKGLTGSAFTFVADPAPELVIYYTEPEFIPTDPLLSVSASADDGQQTAAGVMNIDGISVNLTAVNDRIGMIFRDFPVEPGSSIHSASIMGNIPSSTYDDPHCTIKLQDSDAPAAFTTGSNNISSRTLMAQSVTWDERGLGSGWAESPDISDLFESFIARPGYAAGGDVAVILTALSTALLRFKSFNHTSLEPPRLYLSWTPPDDPPPEDPPPPEIPPGTLTPDPENPLIQHYNYKVVGFAATEPDNLYTLPRFVVKARPDQLLVLIIHCLQWDDSITAPEFTVTLGGFAMGAAESETVEHSTVGGQRWTTAVLVYQDPPAGMGDIVVETDVQVDGMVLSAEMLKLRGTADPDLIRVGTVTWDSGESENVFALDDVEEGDFIIMAHTANSTGSPLFGYTPGNTRYTLNNGDNAHAVSGGSGYHYVTAAADYSSTLLETGGAGADVSGVIIGIRSTPTRSRTGQFTMAAA